jgi:CheY-like chemotaxis protein
LKISIVQVGGICAMDGYSDGMRGLDDEFRDIYFNFDMKFSSGMATDSMHPIHGTVDSIHTNLQGRDPLTDMALNLIPFDNLAMDWMQPNNRTTQATETIVQAYAPLPVMTLTAYEIEVIKAMRASSNYNHAQAVAPAWFPADLSSFDGPRSNPPSSSYDNYVGYQVTESEHFNDSNVRTSDSDQLNEVDRLGAVEQTQFGGQVGDFARCAIRASASTVDQYEFYFYF